MTSYIMLSKFKRWKGAFPYTQILAIRWLRLTVPMVGMILMVYLIPFFGDGPLWNDGVDMLLPPCYNYWHRNILYINNIYFDMPPINEYMVSETYHKLDKTLKIVFISV